jgi:phage tail-like protein
MGAEKPVVMYSTFRFKVTFTPDGTPRGNTVTPMTSSGKEGLGFSEVTGLEGNVELKPHPEGGRPLGVRQLVGRTTFPNLVLKRGMSGNREVWDWFFAVASGKRPVPRKKVLIELQGNGGAVLATWEVSRAVPVKLKASDLNAKTGEVAIEELHLAHEGLVLTSMKEVG